MGLSLPNCAVADVCFGVGYPDGGQRPGFGYLFRNEKEPGNTWKPKRGDGANLGSCFVVHPLRVFC